MKSFFKKSLFFLLSCLFSAHLFAQKPILDTSVFDKWSSVSNAAISNDGEYVSYMIGNRYTGRSELVIQGMDNGWKKSFENSGEIHFSPDSRKVYFQIKDSLYVMTLGKDVPDTVIATYSFKVPRASNSEWLAFQPKEKKGDLILFNLRDGSKKKYSFVENYVWDDKGVSLIISTRVENKLSLQLLNLSEGISTRIWSDGSNGIEELSFAEGGFNSKSDGLCFVIEKKSKDQKALSLWYYQLGSANAIKLADDQTRGVDSSLRLIYGFQFSQNRRWIFIRLYKRDDEPINSKARTSPVDVYTYKDMILQPQQLKRLKVKPSYQAVVSVSGGPVIQLEQDSNGNSMILTNPGNVTGDYVVMAEELEKDFKPWWPVNNPFTYFLISLKDGSRIPFKSESVFLVSDFSFSPNGNSLIYWDSQKASFITYDISSKKATNITPTLPKLFKEGDYVDMFGLSLCKKPFDGVHWVDSGRALLVYTMFDIWKIDPSGKKIPVNLSNGYGAKHHILLRLVDETDDIENQQALVTGFNADNKENGFFRISLNKPANPELLTMGPYSYYRVSSQLPLPRQSFSEELHPLRAREKNVWIISRQSAGEYPNYFYTRDWKQFTALTDLQPQKAYNWLTTELITYKQLDGTPSQGILYKPENFNPAKKYPVIFHYYEHFSYRLHEFPRPEYMFGDINIPWFVGKGYLVFTTDNHYSRASLPNGKTVGEAVYNSVVSAARYLSTFPYVDSKHMAIQGHSFGGGETNYLVTHSTLFAAACSFAGTVSDQVSAYLGPYRPKDGYPDSYRVAHSETGHEMIGATLWERPDLYFRSSSVFTANKVTTPLLLIHNEKDEQTDWGQSFELFSALRRLGKKVWMLQYDGEGHVLFKKQNQVDFTIRLTQFFDHYLKGAPAPIWMTKGIPARLKGVEQGYDLDLSGATP